ncbi:hypothetical protein BbiDN127_I0019 (plasmid) [Borreliella bissettiae DN127]|uniref:Uncharacterized protein n=1 Tax=Borrelia bissettiae (strain DSM 17990 / CIP 109136 / DN127) TaxID=521010 RepID=G0AP76_BORBD|nr:hypothetical protein BbiDN127_I0019 [Borreliella bissettiae DN127]
MLGLQHYKGMPASSKNRSKKLIERGVQVNNKNSLCNSSENQSKF